MQIRDLIREIHHRVEARERIRISQATMAKRIGISTRTYAEYLRGTNSPIAMKAILALLTQLDDEQIGRVLHDWKIMNSNLTSGLNESAQYE